MDAKPTLDNGIAAHAGSLTKPLVAVTGAAWIVVLLISVARLLTTGHANSVSFLLGIAGLLQVWSLATQRRALKSVLTVCGGILALITLLLLLLRQI